MKKHLEGAHRYSLVTFPLGLVGTATSYPAAIKEAKICLGAPRSDGTTRAVKLKAVMICAQDADYNMMGTHCFWLDDCDMIRDDTDTEISGL